MTASWAQRVADAYHLQLPADLAAWLDQERWQSAIGAEFCCPLTPEQLLHPEPGMIWAGFMLPDTLPLIGNEYGDWLCLRVAADGLVRELIYWCHGGGDWIPYGRTLAEALVYDAAFHVMYERRFDEWSHSDRPRQDIFAAAEWAFPWLGSTQRQLARFWDRPATDNEGLLDELLSADIAAVTVRRDMILRHLESQLKQRSQRQTAIELGTPWEPDFVSWLFDTALVPELSRQQLSQKFGVPKDELFVQDWEAAEFHARRVAEARDDLGWAFDILGWAAERSGDLDEAIRHYLAGMRASAFSDDTVRFRTHWFAEGFGKFAASRLFHSRHKLTVEQRTDPYLQIFWKNDAKTLRSRVRDYWLARAERAEIDGEYLLAYRYYYSAGWDCGLAEMVDYLEILDRLARAARKAGASALGAIAELHRDQLPLRR